MRLSKERIVQEAIALLHEQGLKQVTLRNLADRLALKAPSLFWYFRNKDELLALIDETIFRECIEAVPACNSWQDWLRQFGQTLWDAQCKAPEIPQLITQVNLGQETRQTLVQLLHARLAVYGIDMGRAMKMQSSVQALVTGWTVLANVARDQAGDIGLSPARADLAAAIDALIHGWELTLKQG